jgi:hypothetical protein
VKAFIAKMNPVEIDASRGFSVEIPSLHKGEGTPDPRRGDLLLIWFNGQGLIGEGPIKSVALLDRPVVVIASFTRYAQPTLCDRWLRAANRADGSLQARLRTATTETGGTRQVSATDLADLDTARRTLLSTLSRA